MAEASMRLVVGDRSINEVISKRNEIAEEAKKMLQQELGEAETGILIITVEMKRTNVPLSVQSSFNEVNEAIQQKEKMIYQAREEYNKIIPAARGEAERSIKGGEGYALDRINRAKGDSEKFKSILAEYQNARDVTKRRLYLETLGDLYPRIGKKVIIDSGQKNIDIVGTASMNTYDVALRVGKTKQLVCNGTTGKMVWKSSNPKVATVDKKGLVKAIKPGKAMISVSGGNLIGSMTCKVGVSKKITTKQARRKIMAMKKTYKEGLSWTNENRQYFWEPTN